MLAVAQLVERRIMCHSYDTRSNTSFALGAVCRGFESHLPAVFDFIPLTHNLDTNSNSLDSKSKIDSVLKGKTK